MMELDLKKFYTIDAGLFNEFENSHEFIYDKSTYLNILLNDENCFSPSLFKSIARLPNSFILSIYSKDLNDEKLKLILPKLFLLSCLNSSLLSNNNTVTIAILNNNLHSEIAINTALISNYFRGQGNYNMFFPIFNIDKMHTHIQKAGDYILIFDNTPLPVSLSKDINLSTFIIIYFLKKINSVKDFGKIVDDFSSTIQPTFNTDKSLSEYYISKNLVEIEINLWKKRVELYQSFLVLSKTVQKKEYYDVISWYHKEYETLPTWYKRVGHLIKVVMGKRSFKSLFTKNSKK